MKQSDIEEIKAILYLAVGVFAYHVELIPIVIIAWVLATISLITGLVIGYYEQKIAVLKRKLGKSGDNPTG